MSITAVDGAEVRHVIHSSHHGGSRPKKKLGPPSSQYAEPQGQFGSKRKAHERAKREAAMGRRYTRHTEILLSPHKFGARRKKSPFKNGTNQRALARVHRGLASRRR